MTHASNGSRRQSSDLGHAGRLDDRVGRLAEASHHTLSSPEFFDTFAAGVADALSADFVQFLQYDPKDGCFVLQTGMGFPDRGYECERVLAGLHSQAGRAMLDPTGTPVTLGDFSAPYEWADNGLLREEGVRSGIIARIVAGERHFGVLGVFFRSVRRFHAEEESFLMRVAGLLGAAIERLEYKEAAVTWCSRAGLLRAGSDFLRVPARADAILSAAVLAAVSGGAGGSRPLADWCFADALETKGGPLPGLRRVAVNHAEGAPKRLEKAFSTPLEPTAPHGSPRAYATREAELLRRIGPDFIAAVARDREHRKALEEARPYSYICTPLLVQDRFYGALGFLRVETGMVTPFDEEDLDTCVAFATLVGKAIDRGLPRPDIAESRDRARTHASPHETSISTPSDKEQQVLDLMVRGHNMKEIASRLHIDYETVRTHKRHLCQKLGITRRDGNARLVFEARRRGWLPTS